MRHATGRDMSALVAAPRVGVLVGELAENNMEQTMRKSSQKAKKTQVACLGRAPEGHSGRFWTQWIEPKGAALISQTLRPCHFVIKNHGPNSIRLVTEYGDLMDLAPGAVRATYASGTLTVENGGEKSVLIEF